MVLNNNEEIKAEKSSAITATACEQLSDNIKAHSTLKQAALLIDKVIDVASKEFIFRIYDAKYCWYKKIIDPVELRPQISLAIRHTRKLIAKEQNQTPAPAVKSNSKEKRQQQIYSGTLGSDNNETGNCSQDDALMMGFDPRRLKRFKTNDDNCNCFGGVFVEWNVPRTSHFKKTFTRADTFAKSGP